MTTRPSSANKWWYSAQGALLFVLLAMPAAYALTNKVVPTVDASGCPTVMGAACHGAVYLVLVRLLMG